MHRVFAHLAASASVALFSIGCKDEGTRKCQAALADAQQIVTAESSTRGGIERGIAAVDVALAACQAAKRSSEVEQLTNARHELSAHLETLKERAGKTRRNKPTPEQIEELIKHGDSSCPRGMAYKAENSDKQIRCTGPQPIRMTFEKARDYYKNLGFRVTATEAPLSLRAEYGRRTRVVHFREQRRRAALPNLLPTTTNAVGGGGCAAHRRAAEPDQARRAGSVVGWRRAVARRRRERQAHCLPGEWLQFLMRAVVILVSE